MSIELLMLSNHLILCRPLLFLPSIFPRIKVFSSESALHIKCPKYWSFSFSISPSNEYSVLISFRMDWLDLLAFQGTLKSLLQLHSSKAAISQCSAFFRVQLSHLYMTDAEAEVQILWPPVGKNWLIAKDLYPGKDWGQEEKEYCSVESSLVSDPLRPHGLQHTRLPCPSATPGACSNSYPSSWWCHPSISSSVVPFSSCLQSFPASGSFPMSQFFASGGQSSGASASASILSMNIWDWFPLGWTGWILQSKGLSRVFSNTTVQKHQFFSTQLSL